MAKYSIRKFLLTFQTMRTTTLTDTNVTNTNMTTSSKKMVNTSTTTITTTMMTTTMSTTMLPTTMGIRSPNIVKTNCKMSMRAKEGNVVIMECNSAELRCLRCCSVVTDKIYKLTCTRTENACCLENENS